MKWGDIFFEVFALYVKLAFVCLAYFGAISYIGEKRPSQNPPLTKQIGGYLRCIAAVAAVAAAERAFGSKTLATVPPKSAEGQRGWITLSSCKTGLRRRLTSAARA